MPETVFIDTGYILAQVKENDQQHAEALALSQRFEGTRSLSPMPCC